MVHKIVLDNWPIEFFPACENGDRFNIPCNNTFDICEIKRVAAPFITLGYVNNYAKNRYLLKFCEAPVALSKWGQIY